MSEVRLRLHDGTEIEVVEFALPAQATVVCADMRALLELWDKFTPEALAEVTVLWNNAQTLVLRNAGVNGVQATTNSDGTLTAHIYFCGQQEITAVGNPEYVIAAKIMMGEEV